MTPGTHTVMWNADNLTTGIYLVRLETVGFTKVERMMLLK